MATTPKAPSTGPIADDAWLSAEARVYDADGASKGRTLMTIEGDRQSVAAALRSLADRIDPPKPPRPVFRGGPITDTVINMSDPPPRGSSAYETGAAMVVRNRQRLRDGRK